MITNAFMFGFQAKLGSMVAELIPLAIILVPIAGIMFVLLLVYIGGCGWEMASKLWYKDVEEEEE